MHRMLGLIRGYAVRILDILLPPTKTVQLLESMDAHTFISAVHSVQNNLPHTLSLFDYRDPLVKTAVWEIKFRGNKTITALAADTLYEHLIADLGEHVLFSGGISTVLIPVPLAPQRERERGFNQAERIAKLMAERDKEQNFLLSHALIRTRETPSQTKTHGRSERLKNLTGAFAVVSPDEIMGKHVIVLDDVATTGATLGEIHRVLLDAGATSVVGLTFAH